MTPFLLLACLGPKDGTAVGNPATAGFTGIDIPMDIGLELAQADIKVLRMESCRKDEGSTLVWVGEVVDLLDDARMLAELPAGRWCEMTFSLGAEGMHLVGETAAGTPFDVVVHPGEQVEIGRKFTADGQSMLVAVVFEEFVDASELDALGGYVRADPGDPLSDEWGVRLFDSVLVIDDLDKDGFPGNEEPTLFDPWAPEAEASSAGGCDAGTGWGRAAWGAVLVGLIGVIGRRR